MRMEVHNSISNESEDEDNPHIAQLRKDLKRALQNDKLKTDLLNKLTKTVKAKDEKLAELEAKVASNDDEKRQEVEASDDDKWKEQVEELTAEIKTLQDKLLQNDIQAKAATKQWKEIADSKSDEVKTLQDKLQKETQAKEEAELWKERFEFLSAEAKAIEDKIQKENSKRMELVEKMSQQQTAHKEALSMHQEVYTRGVEEFELRADALNKEVATLKEANLALHSTVDKSNRELDDLRASYAAVKSLDQDQKGQIQKLQEEVSSLQAAKAELRRVWTTAANKNQAFQKYIKEERDRTISELTYWKDMNERLYDSFSNNEKLLQEAREEAEFLKSMQDAWKVQIQELTLQLATQKADMAQERFALADQVESLLRQNSHLVEEQTKLTITKDEFREQAEQASERIQQLEYKVDTLTAQRKSIGAVETKRKELQDSLNELQARYESLSAHYKDSLDEMKEERLQFKNTYDSLMEEHKDVTKHFLKARNLINNNATLFVASEMSRQAKVLLDETAKVAGTSIPAVPPELVIENAPPCDDSPCDDDASDAAEEKKLDDQATLPLSVEGVDSMLSFESTKVGTQADDDDESGTSSHESDDETADDSRSLNRAELWFWGLLDSNQSKSMEEDGKELSPSSRRSKIEKSKRPKSKNELKFL